MSQTLSVELDEPLPVSRIATVASLAILLAHVSVDAMAALLPSSLGLVESRFDLTPAQAAWLLGLGAFCSGLAQPACALVSDRLGTRALGVLGIVLAAVGIGSLGMAGGFVSLLMIYAAGMIGIGMFHPIGAATIGHLQRHQRTSAVSLFFVCGMIGGVLGAMFWPRLLALEQGFGWLLWATAPALLLALVLHRSFADLERPLPVAPRPGDTRTPNAALSSWMLIGILYTAATLRFCVNLALTYLYVRWIQSALQAEHAEWSSRRVAEAAAPVVGNLTAATLAGMALGGLAAGIWVRTGREKWPMVLVPVFFAPLLAMFPYASFEAGYLLAVLAGVGFASMIPITIALAQQILPHRTNLASGLMMGGSWALAMLGPRLAELGVARLGLAETFWLTAATLAVAGLVCLPLPAPKITSD